MAIFPIVDDVAQTTTDVPSSPTFLGGIAFNAAGLVHITDTASSIYVNGIPVSATGQVVYVDASAGLPAGTVYVNGLPISGGAVCMSSNAVAFYSNGLPYDINGAIVATVSWSPLSLFESGEQGVWYDPSDFTTMFQDSAGTTPVTAVGQPVGKILDKSGRGNHATQATATARPVLQQDGNGKYYLAFDGVDDSMATAAVNFTSTDKISVFAGVRKLVDITGILLELSANSNATNPGSIGVFAPGGNTPTFDFRTTGTTELNGGKSTEAAPVTRVLTSLHDIGGTTSATELAARVNGVEASLSYINGAGSGNFGNYPLYIGSRGGSSFHFNGRIYSLIVRGALSDAAQIAAAEAYVNSKTGAY
jgi:hypothetical protein